MDVLRLTLRQLQIFVAVASHGSTASAGSQVALSQSATSSAVNELERVLDLQLFDRVGKRLLLNDNGRALLPRARAVLDAAAGIEAMSRDGSAQAQSLNIGASTTIGNYVLPRLLKSFVQASGAGELESWRSKVVIGNTAAICDAVAAFDLDVGLIEGPCHHASLKVTPWLKDEMVVVAARDHPVLASTRRDERVPVKVLRDAVWLVREEGSGTREATDQTILASLRTYRRSIELGSSEAIKHAAAEGLGLACLSSWVVDEFIRSGRLVKVATTLPRLVRQCFTVVHRQKHPTPALGDFLDEAWRAAAAVQASG